MTNRINRHFKHNNSFLRFFLKTRRQTKCEKRATAKKGGHYDECGLPATRFEILLVQRTHTTCALCGRYTRRELFASRHVVPINHSVHCRNSCFETVAPFRLTNVYSLCQRLMTLIILINCSPLIKTPHFSVYINRTTIYAGCSRVTFIASRASFRNLSALPPPRNEIHIEVQSMIHFIHPGEREKCSIHCNRHCRPRNETLAFHRSEIAHFIYLRKSPSNNVDVMGNSYANFASFQMGKRAVKFALFFFLFISDFTLSWAQRGWSIVISHRQFVAQNIYILLT